MTTFTWTVTSLDCYPQSQGHADVVFCVHWTCAGSEGNYTSSVYSTCSVTLDPSVPFIPYSSLTQNTVLGWIWNNGVDKTATESSVQQQIDAQINPTVVSPQLPWV